MNNPSSEPSGLPSLREQFRPERERLRRELSTDQSPSEIVVAGRKALDRVGASIGASDQLTPDLRKTAIWLLEIVKSNTALFDEGREARIEWREIPKEKGWQQMADGLFFVLAAGLGLYAYMQQAALAFTAIMALSVFRLFDPVLWRKIRARLPFAKTRPLALEDLRSRYQIDATIDADPQSLLSHIDDSLATADHILARLSLPDQSSLWHDNPRLIGLIHSLLEAKTGKDGDFAIKLIDQELGAILKTEGIDIVSYEKNTAHMFDRLPAIGTIDTHMAAPALVKDGVILRRGTIWVSEA